MIQIAPSLLAADFSKLAEEIKDIEKGGADLLHLDVMDGHFVPNLTFGVPIIEALRSCTKLPFDVHLMTEHPEEYIAPLEKADVQMVSFHMEATAHADRMVQDIHSRGMKAGAALNPGTSLSLLDAILPVLDFVLIMTVNPGFGGQKLIPYCVSKVAALRRKVPVEKLDIEVDGGITADNAGDLVQAGARILVAGSSVFGKPDRKAAINAFHEKIDNLI